MVDPGKAYRVEFVDIDTVSMEFLKMFLLQWLVIGVIAKTIKESTYLHTFLPFLAQNVKQQSCNRVVTEVEVFQMHTALGLTDGLKHVGKLLSARHE